MAVLFDQLVNSGLVYGSKKMAIVDIKLTYASGTPTVDSPFNDNGDITASQTNGVTTLAFPTAPRGYVAGLTIQKSTTLGTIVGTTFSPTTGAMTFTTYADTATETATRLKLTYGAAGAITVTGSAAGYTASYSSGVTTVVFPATVGNKLPLFSVQSATIDGARITSFTPATGMTFTTYTDTATETTTRLALTYGAAGAITVTGSAAGYTASYNTGVTTVVFPATVGNKLPLLTGQGAAFVENITSFTPATGMTFTTYEVTGDPGAMAAADHNEGDVVYLDLTDGDAVSGQPAVADPAENDVVYLDLTDGDAVSGQRTATAPADTDQIVVVLHLFEDDADY